MNKLKSLFLLSMLLFSSNIHELSAQSQLKQFGTRIYDESGRKLTYTQAYRLVSSKSETAKMAFKLASKIRETQYVYRALGGLNALYAIIPTEYITWSGETYYDYDLNNLGYSLQAAGWIFFSLDRKELEEVLMVGVASYNEAVSKEKPSN